MPLIARGIYRVLIPPRRVLRVLSSCRTSHNPEGSNPSPRGLSSGKTGDLNADLGRTSVRGIVVSANAIGAVEAKRVRAAGA